MLIDWFTVGAQVLNFVILVWLMKRFLYRPVLDAVDAREKRISAELADAQAKQAEAQAARDDFQSRKTAFEAQRDALLAQARTDAQAETTRLMAAARSAADALSARQRQALQDDATRLAGSIVDRTRRAVFDIARNTLAQLADTTLEARAVAVFIGRLRQLNGDALQLMVHAVRTTADPVLVRSAFDLPADQVLAIETALKAVFGSVPALRFETRPDIVAGIELSADGQKLAWTISGELAGLQERIAKAGP